MAVTTSEIDASDDELEEILDMSRMMMRDKAENNILLADVQFEDKEIKQAMDLAVSEFNSMPPSSNLNWRLIPEDILFVGTASYLMLAESFMQLRNQVSVPTDGMGVVGVDDKSQFYQQLRDTLKREFLRKSRKKKNEMNIAAGFGSMSSGYSNVSRFTNN